MSNNFVEVSIGVGGVVTVSLSRPEKRNAFDDLAVKELHDIFSELSGNRDVRVVLLSAEGSSFSAGADLNWMQRMAAYNYEDNLTDAKALANMLRTLNTMPQPTIARVQGAAYGGAVGLVSCCDVAFASEKATFCLSEVKLGLIPATIGPYVIAAIGQRAARRYFQTAEVFSAQKAAALGLVNECVGERELDKEIENCVRQLLQNGPLAMEQAKKLIFEIANSDLGDELIEHTSERIASLRVSVEGQEGLSAFLEKRKPNWLEE